MSFLFSQTLARKSYSNCFNIIILAVMLSMGSILGLAQGGVGSTRGLPSTSGGIHTIQGQVFFPSGTRSDARVKVRLDSNVSGGSSTTTDADGSFIFNSLGAGNYTVIVDAGPEYEPVRESVTIYGSSGFEGRVSPQSISVPIVLRPKGTPDPLASLSKAAREAYSKGMDAARAGDSKKAIEQLNKAISAAPDFVWALDELGQQYLKENQVEKAIEVLQKAVTLAPKEFNPHLHYGIALLNKRDFFGAEKELRIASEINSAAPTVHMYLGIALVSSSKDEKTKQFDAARYNEAQTELETAVASDKAEVALAHRYLGGIYWGNKDYKRAADEFEAYLKLLPKPPADADKIQGFIKDLRSKG